LKRLDARGQGRVKNPAYVHAPVEDPILHEHFQDYRSPFEYLRTYLPGLSKVCEGVALRDLCQMLKCRERRFTIC
jgi:hypothetical protein